MYCAGAGTEPCVLTVQYTSPRYPVTSESAVAVACGARFSLRCIRASCPPGPPSAASGRHRNRPQGCGLRRFALVNDPLAELRKRELYEPKPTRPSSAPPSRTRLYLPPALPCCSCSSHLRLPLLPLALLLGRRVEYLSIGTQRLLRPRIRDAQGVLSVLLKGYSQLSTLACSLGRHLPSRLCKPIRTCAPCDRRRVSIARSGAYGCPGAATHVGAW